MKASTIARVTIRPGVINRHHEIHLHPALQEIDERVFRFYFFPQKFDWSFFVDLPSLSLFQVFGSSLEGALQPDRNFMKNHNS